MTPVSKHINKSQHFICNMTWVSKTLLSDTAAFTKQFDSLEPDQNSSLAAVAPITVPAAFDGRKVWRVYLPPVKNQCNCGGCWAFATSSALAARINIWTTNRVHVDLSPAKMIYCNWGSDQEYTLVKRAFQQGLDFTDMMDDIAVSAQQVGCSGETLIGAWQFLYRYGATTEKCHPYRGKFDLCAVGAGQKLPTCMEISGPEMGECQDGSAERRYRTGGFYMVAGPLHMGESDTSDNNGNGRGNGQDKPRKYSADHKRRHIADNVARIQREIWKFGPVTTGMVVYSDLFNWDGTGVYEWDGTSAETGGHAVVITGWGSMDVPGKGSVPYWQILNSWGLEWGDKGYFRILRGVNHCDIEVNVMAGYPDMPLSDRFLLQPRLRTPEDIFLKHVWDYDDSGFDLMDIHRIILDEAEQRDVTPVYTASMVPDYQTMIAGKPGAIRYPYATTRTRYGLLAFWLLVGVLVLVVAYVVYQ